VQRAPVVPNLHRSEGKALDRTAQISNFDVFTDTKGVINHIEYAGKNVFQKALCSKPDHKSDNASSCKHGAQIHPGLRQRNQAR